MAAATKNTDTNKPADIEPTGEVVAATTDEETGALAPGVDIALIIESMNDSSKVVTTITGTDFDARIALASALTSSEPVADHLGETINLQDYVITEAQFVSKETGELVSAPRIVLVDADGAAYHGVSVGMLTALRNIKLAVGELWGQKPVPVKVVRQRGNNGFHYHTIQIVR